MICKIRLLFVKYKAFILYSAISVFVTFLDVFLCRLSELVFSPVVSNTIGVVSGFILQYFLTSRHVYNSRNIKTFVIFLLTFFIGLILANSIVWICREILFEGDNTNVAFLISKGASVVLPFFVMYYIRKRFIK